MNATRSKRNKIVASVFGLMLLASGAAAFPQRAHAQFVVIDPAHITQDVVFQHVLNPLAWIIAKTAVQSITKSMVNWINSGFNGSPAFETNLNAGLLKVGDTVALQFIQQLGTAGAIKSPFQTVVAQAVSQNYLKSTATGTSSPFALQHPFTLGQVSPNPTAFLNGDFTQGGWGAWFSAVTHPENNPYGSSVLAQQALTSGISSQQQTHVLDYTVGKGFLSWKGTCAATGAADSGSGTGKSCTKDDDCAGTLACIAGKCAVDHSLDPVPLTATDNCLAYNIKTPGSVLASQIDKVVGSGIDQLNLADSFDEIIGALASQLVNQVVGVAGLSGVSQPTTGAGGSTTASYLDQISNPSQTSGVIGGIGASLATIVTGQRASVSGYVTNWQTINTAAQAAKAVCVSNPAGLSIVNNVIAQAAAAISKGTAAIAALDKITAELNAAAASGGDPTTLMNIGNEYQALQSSSVLPSAADISLSQTQSQDSGSSTPASLYTQMVKLSQNGCSTGS